MKVITLAHYYTIPEVQAMADFVGDSLDLSLAAKESNADVIVFAGVRFMAETAKLLNPNATVIIPDFGATCSLVEDTNVAALKSWDSDNRAELSDVTHAMYINSSVEMKALADIIVTSRNVDDIIRHEMNSGNNVIFSPDYNMGKYLNYVNNWDMPVWSAVCEVHEKFNIDKLGDEIVTIMKDSGYANIPMIIAHPESPLSVLKQADFVGSTSKMLQWIKNYDDDDGGVVFVATEDGILHNMREARPDLDIRQAPTYKGCQCNSCPYMKMNTIQSVKNAQDRKGGTIIDYIDKDLASQAARPLHAMLEFDE